ncbi:MAG: diguanylate cyclase domain-containing protein [Chitinophagales bacterium]
MTLDYKDDVQNQLQKFLMAFDSLPVPIILLDENHHIENLNSFAKSFLEKDKSDVAIKKEIIQVLPWLAEDLNSFFADNVEKLTLAKDVDAVNGERKYLVILMKRLVGVDGQFWGTVIVISDLTERKQTEEKLRYISFHDELTGLYNRSYFEQEMTRLESGRCDTVAVISCDVDGLKLINDTMGHQLGDRILIQAATIIRNCFRENDVVARIGGDEFAVLLPDSTAAVVENACNRLRQGVKKYNALNRGVPLSVSIGWAVWDKSRTISDAYREADDNMYSEKPENRKRFFQQLIQETIGGKLKELV